MTVFDPLEFYPHKLCVTYNLFDVEGTKSEIYPVVDDIKVYQLSNTKDHTRIRVKHEPPDPPP